MYSRADGFTAGSASRSGRNGVAAAPQMAGSLCVSRNSMLISVPLRMVDGAAVGASAGGEGGGRDAAAGVHAEREGEAEAWKGLA